MSAKEGHTIKDMAKELDVSYVTVLNMIDREQIKAIRMGGRWIIPTPERRRFLKEGNHPDSKNTSTNGNNEKQEKEEDDGDGQS